MLVGRLVAVVEVGDTTMMSLLPLGSQSVAVHLLKLSLRDLRSARQNAMQDWQPTTVPAITTTELINQKSKQAYPLSKTNL